ncbi:MAG TPA: hypothetical protein PLG97_04290 [Alcaligenes sp.]|nr:hypothetical protein [Alcaligenes sp.]HRL26717.1 hypothetical protein [Alcaligenes sp.]
MSRPVDETPQEFRLRPARVLDKGTGAQHRQTISPDGPAPDLNGDF